MKRRCFITILGGAAAAWPLTGRAQQQAIPMVGFLHSGPAGSNSHLVGAFRRGLGETGYVEGQNVVIEYRWTEGQYDRLASLAADLIGRSGRHLGRRTSSRAGGESGNDDNPVVFVSGDDPTKSGLVEKSNRPGDNVTGIVLFSGSQLWAKQLDLLHELVPTAAVIGLLINPTNSTQAQAQTEQTEAAAHRLGVRLHVGTPAPKATSVSVCDPFRTADRCVDSRGRSLFHQPARSAGCIGGGPCAASGLQFTGIRCSCRSHELWQ